MRLLYSYQDDIREITSYTADYQRNDNIDTLGEEFTFTLYESQKDENMKNLALNVGGKVIFSNAKENNLRTHVNNTVDTLEDVFCGIITSVKRSGLNQYSYTCFDYAYYLNKSQTLSQFNDVPSDAAIKMICAENDIPIGNICSISHKIKKLYCGETLSDAIKDILKLATDATGIAYRLEVRRGKLYIEEYKDLILDTVFVNIGSFNYSASIDEVRNKVTVVTDNQNSSQVFGKAKDEESIKIFGTLHHVEKIKKEDEGKAEAIAKELLNAKGTIKEEFSTTLLGLDAVRSGRILIFKTSVFNGAFLVVSCKHSYSNTHTMDLTLKKVK